MLLKNRHLPAITSFVIRALMIISLIGSNEKQLFALVSNGNTKPTITESAASATYTITDEIRLLALKNQWLKDTYPEIYEQIVATLTSRVHYATLNEFLQESSLSSWQRQRIARRLTEVGTPLNVSQSEADFLTYSNPAQKKQFLKTYATRLEASPQKHDQCLTTLNAIFMQEKIENSAGSFVVYHGISPELYVQNYIGTQLRYHATTPKSFLCLRHDEESQSFSTRSSIWQFFFGNTDSEMRIKLLARKGFDQYLIRSSNPELRHEQDTNFDTRNDGFNDMRRYLLSCVFALASSTDDEIEAALYYWLNAKDRFNYVQPEINSDDLPVSIQTRISNAIQDFLAEEPSGVLLQISLSPSLIDQAMYPALPSGIRHNIYAGDRITPITSCSTILQQARSNPFDIWVKRKETVCNGLDPLQFRLILDKDLLLNPQNTEVRNHFKVYTYSCPQEALDRFHQEINEIMQDI